jgi:RNA polymerase sigma-70 factor (ECF subfamily)
VSWRDDGALLSVLAFTVVDGRISEITAVTDPAKLALVSSSEIKIWG